MCWTCRINPIKQIAHEDFIVYKILVNGNSKYYKYHYTLGKLEVLSKDMEVIWDNPYFEISEGFHSYRVSKATQVADHYRLYFNDGYSDWYLDVVEPFYSVELYECTIPKGSIYYDNGFGEIVSNQIIVNKLIDVRTLLSLKERIELKAYNIVINAIDTLL